jgi:hypothetical protein
VYCVFLHCNTGLSYLIPHEKRHDRVRTLHQSDAKNINRENGELYIPETDTIFETENSWYFVYNGQTGGLIPDTSHFQAVLHKRRSVKWGRNKLKEQVRKLHIFITLTQKCSQLHQIKTASDKKILQLLSINQHRYKLTFKLLIL